MKKLNEIAAKASLAMILEAYADPKPLAVSKNLRLKNLSFENFAATATHLQGIFFNSCKDGYKGKQRIGFRIYQAVKKMLECQSAGNTSLGSIMLLIPLINATGKLISDGFELNLENLREKIKELLALSDHKDSIHICKAILLVNPKWLVKVEDFDITKEGWEEEIIARKANLKDVMRVGEKFDWIAYEYVNDYYITFNECYPYLKKIAEEENIEKAVAKTFLWMMARRFDSHIARKIGIEKAEEIRSFIEKIIEKFSLEEVCKIVNERYLRLGIVAGTTGDLLVASIFLLLITEGTKKYI